MTAPNIAGMQRRLAALAPFAPLAIYALIAVGLVAGAYFVYRKFGAGAPDPGGGAPSTGVLDGILNQTLEIGRSPLNYTSALQQTVIHPLDTIESILGIAPSSDLTPRPPSGTSQPASDIADQLDYLEYSGVTP